MPRTPLGDRAMTNAERQARYRAARAAALPAIRYRRAADRRSRPRRWRDAVAELVTLQAKYAAWLDALPETLRDGATGDALQAIVELDPRRADGNRSAARIRTRLNSDQAALDRHPTDAKNTHASEAPNPGDIIS